MIHIVVQGIMMHPLAVRWAIHGHERSLCSVDCSTSPIHFLHENQSCVSEIAWKSGATRQGVKIRFKNWFVIWPVRPGAVDDASDVQEPLVLLKNRALRAVTLWFEEMHSNYSLLRSQEKQFLIDATSPDAHISHITLSSASRDSSPWSMRASTLYLWHVHIYTDNISYFTYLNNNMIKRNI